MKRLTALSTTLGAALLCTLAAGCTAANQESTGTEEDDGEKDLGVAGTGSDLMYVPRISSPNSIPERATLLAGGRQGLKCMQELMQAAYAANPPSEICGLVLEPAFSNEYVVLYSGVGRTTKTNQKQTRRLVVSFAGTHNWSDWINNIASGMSSVQHNNPFLGTLALNGGRVGRGWKTRWVNQATLQHQVGGTPVGSLVDRLKQHANAAMLSDQSLTTFVVGHSLGAVTADVAAYDIAEWQSKVPGLQQEVVVGSFDMPRLGQIGARTAYQEALKNTCYGPAWDKMCIRRFALTRTYDPVQSAPPGMDQILWQTGEGNRTMGIGPYANTALAYCPQFNAPFITNNPVQAVDNHSSSAWVNDLTNNLSSPHLACMLGESTDYMFRLSSNTRNAMPLSWSSAGPIAGKSCVQINEPSDPDTWNDNYLCSDEEVGLKWSNAGPIAGMRCTQMSEGSEPASHTWNDNYVCVPNASPIHLSWSSAGPIPGKACVWTDEASDPHTWGDNYLCVDYGLQFHSAGGQTGKNCVHLREEADPDSWSDNYLCSDVSFGIEWSNAGPIAGMRCTQINEGSEPASHTWNDNYLCVPHASPLQFSWSMAGPIAGKTCVSFNEAADPHAWGDNYLCY